MSAQESHLAKGGEPRAVMDGERQQPASVEGRQLCCMSALGVIDGGIPALVDHAEVQRMGNCFGFTNSFVILLLLYTSIPWCTVRGIKF